jgi:hypothetical protein
VRYVSTRRGDAYNPVFELIRGGAHRSGFHQRIKRILKLHGPTESDTRANDESMTSARRTRLLWRLSSSFDVILFALSPIEKLFDVMGWGPELFLVAERRD